MNTLGFLLNHSVSYVIAVLISLVEQFLLLRYCNFYEILPSFVTFPILTIGLAMILLGHFFRIGAEFTAGSNFNHRI